MANTVPCVCSLCNFSSPTKALWRDIDGCGASYSKCASLVSHVYRQHRERISAGRKTNNRADMPRQSDDFQGDGRSSYFGGQDVSMNEHSQTDLQHVIDQILQTDGNEQQKKGALYILGLKEKCGLSESVVNHVIKETQKVFDHTIGRAKAGVDE